MIQPRRPNGQFARSARPPLLHRIRLRDIATHEAASHPSIAMAETISSRLAGDRLVRGRPSNIGEFCSDVAAATDGELVSEDLPGYDDPSRIPFLDGSGTMATNRQVARMRASWVALSAAS